MFVLWLIMSRHSAAAELTAWQGCPPAVWFSSRAILCALLGFLYNFAYLIDGVQ